MQKIFTLLLLVFIYNISSAQLTFIENYAEGQGGIEGLNYPRDMELDSAGNMYIIGNSSYLHLFMPESAEYAKFVEQQNANTTPGLGNVDEIKAVPNHKFFYMVADNKLLLFTRNQANNQLVYSKTFENNSDVQFGYGVFTDLAISPDGRNLYMAREDDTDQPSLTVFAIDSLSGDLAFKNKINDVRNINNIVCNNQFVYTTSRGNYENSIRVYKKSTDNNLVLVQKINAADSLSQIKSMTLSTDNRFLYVSDNNSVLVFETGQTNGNLLFSDKITIRDFYSRFWNESTLMASPDNGYVYLTDFMGVMVFKREVKTGKLTHIQSIEGDSEFKMFYSISSIKISMDGTKVMILSKYNNSIVLFSRDKTTGKLLYSSTIKNEQKKIRGVVDASDILITKNDKHLYTLAQSGTNNIGFYKRTPDGKLEFEKNTTWSELGPEIGAVKDFQLGPDGKTMYISSTNMYGIRILNRDTISGDLTFYKSYTDAGTGVSNESISEFVIPADGKNLYAATYNSLVNYQIDQTTHDLKFITKLTTDGKTGYGIPGWKKIIASKDGKNIYTFSSSMDFVGGISVFSRMADGRIQQVENLDSYQFKFMVDQPFSIAMSPDDKYLYAAGTSLFCFKRNPDNGKLTFNYEIKYEDLNLGIYRLQDLTISKDGRYLLAVSNEKKIALSFYRSTENGKLLLKQLAHFSEDNNYSVAVPFSMFSNDMKNAYIVSPYDGTLGVYEAAIPLGLTPTMEFCKGDVAEISVDEGYNYLWSNGETQHLIKTTTPGEYSVKVTDNTGRKGSDKTNVLFHNPPIFSFAVDSTLSNNNFTFIYAIISEGSYPLSYSWNNGSTFEFVMANNPDSIHRSREYILTITDKYGCYTSGTITLTYNLNNSKEEYVKNDQLISIFPNPFDQYISIGFQNTRYGNLSVRVIDLDGKELLRSCLESEQPNRLDLSFLKRGIYILEVTENNVTEKRKIIKL